MAWIFLNDCFISAVQHNDDPDLLVVRARVDGHLEAFLAPHYPTEANRDINGIKIERHPNRDYLFRVILPKSEVADLMSYHMKHIDYGNFKDSVGEHDYHESLYAVWSAMNNLQGLKHGVGAYIPQRYR
jgi:hypothetical protein